MNKVMLMGRLTADPKINAARTVSNYSIAVNRAFAKQGEANVDFFNCVAFNKAGEFANTYFKKGMLVAIVGHLQTTNWEDAQGIKHYGVQIIIEEQHFAESKKDTESNAGAVQGGAPTNAVPSTPSQVPQQTQIQMSAENMQNFMADDDLPF